MKFEDKEKIRQFLTLVKTGAGVKAYRNLGLDRNGIKEHLGYLAEYEKILAQPELPATPDISAHKPKLKKREDGIVQRRTYDKKTGDLRNPEGPRDEGQLLD